MAEPEPGAGRPEPEGRPEMEQHVDMNISQTPEAEPGNSGYAAAYGVWWDLHCYGLGSVFLVLGIYALGRTYVLIRRRRGQRSATKPFLVSISTLVALMCLCRATFLFVDPYFLTTYFPRILNIIIFNAPFPCMSSNFAMIMWVLHEVGQMKLSSRSRGRGVRALVVIIVSHFALVILISSIIEFTQSEILLIVLCHGFFVLWGLFLCFGSLYLTYNITNMIRSTQETLRRISIKGHTSSKDIGDTKQSSKNVTQGYRNCAPITETKIEIRIENCHHSESKDTPANLGISPENVQEDESQLSSSEATESSVVKSPSQRQLLELDPTLLQSSVTAADSTSDGDRDFNPDDGQQFSGGVLQPAISDRSIDALTSDDAKSEDAFILKMAKLFRNVRGWGSRRRSLDNRKCTGEDVVASENQPAKRKERRMGRVAMQDSPSRQMKQRRNTPSPNPSPSLSSKQSHPSRPFRLSGQSTFADMNKRAKATTKVTRITIIIMVTNCAECILNLFFILSVFPRSGILRNSMIEIFIFWTFFRITEIAMACAMIYFVAQPMPTSKMQRRSTIKSFISSLRKSRGKESVLTSSTRTSTKTVDSRT